MTLGREVTHTETPAGLAVPVSWLSPRTHTGNILSEEENCAGPEQDSYGCNSLSPTVVSEQCVTQWFCLTLMFLGCTLVGLRETPSLGHPPES